MQTLPLKTGQSARYASDYLTAIAGRVGEIVSTGRWAASDEADTVAILKVPGTINPHGSLTEPRDEWRVSLSSLVAA